jgi:hypothetical protein
MQLISHPQTFNVANAAAEMQLPQRDQPNDLDIVCERGKAFRMHRGNKKFSDAIRSNVEKYHLAPKRRDKSIVVATVISTLRGEGYRFVKLDKKTERYYEIGEHLAHEKTGHALRDLLKVWERSSKNESSYYNHIQKDLKQSGWERSDKQPKRSSVISAEQVHEETGNAVRDLLELRNRQNGPFTMGIPSTIGVASPTGSKMTHSLDVVGESDLNLTSTMVVASHGVVGGSDIDSTTIMMGRGRGRSRLLRTARTHRRSFVVCFPTTW